MFFMNAASELTCKNRVYREAMELYIWGAYLQDLNKDDITTKYFVPKKRKKVIARIILNENGVLAGIEEAEWFLDHVGIDIIKSRKDGTKAKKGDVIMKIEGKAYLILAAERTLLNLLQRMSGVATATNRLASKIPKNIKLLATRKTLWGIMDKKAVVIGGGGTHRLNLSDAVLIKDNHLALSMRLKKELKKVFKKTKRSRFVEIEFDNIKDADSFLEIFGILKTKGQKIVVMLDNFSLPDIKKIVPKLKKAGLYTEVSGGINEKNIKKYCIKGVTAISSGAITGKADCLDISLSITK
jgi:nicotinate-nucleotide pyrophosphorylase (carboxylating)